MASRSPQAGQGGQASNLISRSWSWLPIAEVHTAWDLGYDDSTAIWWFQVLRGEIHILDYYENNGQDIPHYCDVVSDRARDCGYRYGKHYVPHDAANELLAAGGRSIVQQAFALGIGMRVVAATSQQNGIEAVSATKTPRKLLVRRKQVRRYQI